MSHETVFNWLVFNTVNSPMHFMVTVLAMQLLWTCGSCQVYLLSIDLLQLLELLVIRDS